MNKFFSFKTSGFWKIISAIVALSLFVIAGILFYVFGCEVMHWWGPNGRGYDTEEQLSRNITYKYRYNYYEENVGSIVDNHGHKILKGVNWVSENSDSIVVFAQNGYRGYLDRYTGKVLVPATKFTQAYIYSEGRALALTQDSLFVLDENGAVVKGFPGRKLHTIEKHCYLHGRLPMVGESGKIGLIDKSGEWVVEPEYDTIDFSEGFWYAQKDAVPADGEYAAAEPARATIFDDSLRIVLQGEWTDVSIKEEGVVVTYQDHSQHRYGFDGKLIDDFLCDRVEILTYQTGETGFRTNRFVNDGEESVYTEEYQIEAVASLRKYVTSANWEGLMTPDGRPVTLPLYRSIRAVGKNLYLCHYDQMSYHGVLLNEKGELVAKYPKL